jgi:hypothetical protein
MCLSLAVASFLFLTLPGWLSDGASLNWGILGHLYMPAHFHSRKFSTDRKFSEKSLLKLNLKIFFRRRICVGQSHFTNFSFRGKFSWVELGLNTDWSQPTPPPPPPPWRAAPILRLSRGGGRLRSVCYRRLIILIVDGIFERKFIYIVNQEHNLETKISCRSTEYFCAKSACA